MGANAQTTVPTFVAAQVLTATQLNNSARTGVPVFATTVERDAAFGGSGEKTLAEGQLCYLEDSNVVQYYDGAAWATVGPSASGVVQVKSTFLGTDFTTTSTSYVDVTGLSVSITPTSASNKVLVLCGAALSAGAGRGFLQLVRGSTDIAISTGFAGSNSTSCTAVSDYMSQYVGIAYLDSPATTSATTYKFKLKADSGTTARINSQAGSTDKGNVSTITVMEVLP